MPRLLDAVMATLQRSEHVIDAVMRPVVFAGMAALIAVITLQVVSRVFFTAVGWTEEVARFLLVWITFLGATLAFRHGRHIAVTFVVDALPDRLRRLARMAAMLVVLGFMIALIVIGYRYMQVQSFQKSASLRLSMTWVYAVIPLSAAVMAWYALADLIRLGVHRGARDPIPPPDEPPA